MVKIIKEDREGRLSSLLGRNRFYTDIEKRLKYIIDVYSAALRVPFITSANVTLRNDVERFLNSYEWQFFDDLAEKYEAMFSDSDDPYNAAFDAIEKRVSNILYDYQKADELYEIYKASTTKALNQIVDVYIEDLSDVLAEIISSDDVEDVFGKSKEAIVDDIKRKGITPKFLKENPELSFVELEGEDEFVRVSSSTDGLMDILTDESLTQLDDYDFTKPFSKSKSIGRHLLNTNTPSSFEDVVTTIYSDKLKDKILSKVK